MGSLKGFLRSIFFKDYSKDTEDEIRGQYADGNCLYDENGKPKSLDEALSGVPNNDEYSLTSLLGNNGLLGALVSYLNSKTGNALTGAQREQNQFNAEQAAIQRGYEERLSNTAYQRGVVDMENAGLNPALMYGSGSAAATPSGAVASGSSPASPTFSLMSMLMQAKQHKEELRTQKEIAEIQANASKDNAKESADATRYAADSSSASNKYGVDVNADLTKQQIEIAMRELSLKEYLTTSQVDEINHRISLIDEQGLSEKARQILLKAQSVLAHNQSYEINYLVSAKEQLMLSQAHSANSQDSAYIADAYLKATEAAWKNHLIDGGYLDSMIKEASSNSSIRERLMDIKDGKPFKTDYGDFRDIPNKILNITFGNVVQAVDAVGGAILSGLAR